MKNQLRLVMLLILSLLGSGFSLYPLWSPAQRIDINSGGTIESKTVAQDSAGTLMVGYVSKQSGLNSLYFTYLNQGTFTTPQLLLGPTSDSILDIQLAFPHKQHQVLFWKKFSNTFNTYQLFSAHRLNGVWVRFDTLSANLPGKGLIDYAVQSAQSKLLLVYSQQGTSSSQIYYRQLLANNWTSPVTQTSVSNYYGSIDLSLRGDYMGWLIATRGDGTNYNQLNAFRWNGASLETAQSIVTGSFTLTEPLISQSPSLEAQLAYLSNGKLYTSLYNGSSWQTVQQRLTSEYNLVRNITLKYIDYNQLLCGFTTTVYGVEKSGFLEYTTTLGWSAQPTLLGSTSSITSKAHLAGEYQSALLTYEQIEGSETKVWSQLYSGDEMYPPEQMGSLAAGHSRLPLVSYKNGVACILYTRSSGSNSQLYASIMTGRESYLDWNYSKLIQLNTSATGAATTTDQYDLPLLIRLDGTNFSFNQSQMQGKDLRFTDLFGNPLFHQIDSWDSTVSEGKVWVRVNEILGNTENQYIRMYWGKPGALDRSHGPSLFNGEFRAVWRMDSLDDKSGNENHLQSTATSTPQVVPGIIGPARRFDGIDDYLMSPFQISLNLNTSLSIFGWYRSLNTGAPSGDQVLWSRKENVIDNSGWEVSLKTGYDSALQIYSSSGSPANYQSIGQKWSDQQWHHIVVNYNNSFSSIYIDGVFQGFRSIAHVLDMPTDLVLGKNASLSGAAFKGEMDELWYYNDVLDSNAIKLIYHSQSPTGKLYKTKGVGSFKLLPGTQNPSMKTGVIPDKKNVLLSHFILNIDSIENVLLHQISFNLGSGSPTPLQNIRLIQDKNSNGMLDAGDSLLSQVAHTLDSQFIHFTLSGFVLNKNSLNSFLILSDISSSPLPTPWLLNGYLHRNNVHSSGLSSQVSVQRQGESVILPGLQAQKGLLNLSPGSFIPTLGKSVAKLSTQVPLFHVQLKTDGFEYQSLDYITFILNRGPSRFLNQIRLYRDKNENEIFDAGDTLLQTKSLNSLPPQVRFDSLGLLIPEKNNSYFLVGSMSGELFTQQDTLLFTTDSSLLKCTGLISGQTIEARGRLVSPPLSGNADTTAPPMPTKFIINPINETTVEVRWDTIKTPDVDSLFLVYRTDNSLPLSYTDGTRAGTFSKAQLVSPLNGFMLGTRYSFALFARDTAGNFSKPAWYSSQTRDVTPPSVSVNTLYTNNRKPKISGFINDPACLIEINILGRTYPAAYTSPSEWAVPDGHLDPLPDGFHDIKVTAKDSVGNSASDTGKFDLYIDATPPHVEIEFQTTQQEKPTLRGKVREKVSAIKILIGNLPDTLQARLLTGLDWVLDSTLVPPLKEGIYNIQAMALDSMGNWGFDSTQNELRINLKDPPRFKKKNDTLLVLQNKQVEYFLSATDPDSGTQLRYTNISSLPSWITLSADMLQLRTSQEVVGLHNFSFEVTDDDFKDTLNLHIQVKNINDAPLWSQRPLSIIAEEDQFFTLTFNAFDADQDSLTYIYKGPEWLKGVRKTNNQWVLEGTPQNKHTGTSLLRLQVNDGITGDSLVIQLTVKNVNDPPYFSSLPRDSQMIWLEDSIYSWSLTLIDPDFQDSLFLSNLKLPPATVLSSVSRKDSLFTYNFTSKPEQNDVGFYSPLLEWKDKEGSRLTYQFKLQIQAVNDRPQLSLTQFQTAGGALRVFLNAVDEDDSLSSLTFTHFLTQQDTEQKPDSLTGQKKNIFFDSATTTVPLFNLYPLLDGKYTYTSIARDPQGSSSDTLKFLFEIKDLTPYSLDSSSWDMWAATQDSFTFIPHPEIEYFNWSDKSTPDPLLSQYKKGSALGKAQAGRAYWVYSDKIVAGQRKLSQIPRQDLFLDLEKGSSGWNQLGNPFPYPILIKNSLIQLECFNGTTKDFLPVDSILPAYAACWARTSEDQRIELKAQPYFSSGKSLKKVSRPQGIKEWNLILSAGTFQDSANSFGLVHKGSLYKKTRYEPPRMGSFVSLAFKNPEENAASQTEYFQTLESQQTEYWWTLEMNSVGKAPLTGYLHLQDFDQKNKYKFYLIKQGEAVLLTAGDSLPVQLARRGSIYQLALSSNPNFITDIQKPFSVSNPVPMPIQDFTRFNLHIPYTLHQNQIQALPTHLDFALYNSKGQRMSSFKTQSLLPGRHDLTWNRPMGLSGGLYFYQIKTSTGFKSQGSVFLKP